jgi:hypothetical protein
VAQTTEEASFGAVFVVVTFHLPPHPYFVIYLLYIHKKITLVS